MKKSKVICIGEALIDRIKNSSNEKFTDFLGGAPANVACALKKLQIDSVFIGSLGNDKFGKKFTYKFNELEVNIDLLQIVNNLPTRIVKVNRNDFGDRYFFGFDANPQTMFADEALSWHLIKKDIKSLEKLLLETKYIVAGTIILSSSISKETIYCLLKQAKKFKVKTVIDLNWREVFWDFSTFSSEINKEERVDLIKSFLNHADILKMAKEEAISFFNDDNPLEISAQILSKPDVIITDGENPISWFINGYQGKTEVISSSKIVDTTGAGDAFLAGLISKLLSSNYPGTKLDIQNYVKFASICGYLTCLGEGAIEQQPDYEKINQFLGSQIL